MNVFNNEIHILSNLSLLEINKLKRTDRVPSRPETINKVNLLRVANTPRYE